MTMDEAKLRARFGNIDKQRIVERKQGCWNCKHWDADKAIALWWEKARETMLSRALKIAIESPQGENDQRVVNIRTTVPQLDEGMTNRIWGICALAGKGNTVNADFVASTHMCGSWSGAEGASVAIGGEKADKLPAELLREQEGLS